MTDRTIVETAIMAAVFAAVVAVPLSVCAQPVPDVEPGLFAETGMDAGLSERVSVHACLHYRICPDRVSGRESEQSAHSRADSGPDRRILIAVHSWDSRSANIVFGAADASAYPVFAAAPLALWGSVVADGVSPTDAVAGSVALAAGFGTAMLLKRMAGRSRPYAGIDGFEARTEYAGSSGLSESSSFPSGHATIAAVVAAGSALLIRHPAATAGAIAWAGTVSVSRVWLGVHYPSDVVAGAALGAGAAMLSFSVLR